jgi:opacity protein-like surface antigen
MKLALAIIAVLGVGAAMPIAQAEEPDQGQGKTQGQPEQLGDWYLSGFIGGAFLEGARNQGEGGHSLSLQNANDPGYAIRGAFGSYRTSQVRVEGEISFRRAGFGTVSVTNDGGLGAAAGRASLGGFRGSASGDVSALSFMANAYYDYDTGSPWRPYWALGVGFARVALESVRIAGVPVADDEDWVFAYQFGLGIGYEITPRTTLALDYRYFATLDPTLRDAAGGKFTSDFTSHNLSIGIRYRF